MHKPAKKIFLSGHFTTNRCVAVTVDVVSITK